MCRKTNDRGYGTWTSTRAICLVSTFTATGQQDSQWQRITYSECACTMAIHLVSTITAVSHWQGLWYMYIHHGYPLCQHKYSCQQDSQWQWIMNDVCTSIIAINLVSTITAGQLMTGEDKWYRSTMSITWIITSLSLPVLYAFPARGLKCFHFTSVMGLKF